MSISGKKQIIWASAVLMLWAVIMIVLLIRSLVMEDRDLTALTYVAGFSAVVLSIAAGILAIKYKENMKKALILNILGAVCALLYVVFMITADESVVDGIGFFLSLLYIGGVNRNRRYLKMNSPDK